jgi:hypothetical protein
MVAGGFDYLVKARLSDMTAYRRFLGDVLLPLPGVKETRTYAVMEEVKSYAPFPCEHGIANRSNNPFAENESCVEDQGFSEIGRRDALSN